MRVVARRAHLILVVLVFGAGPVWSAPMSDVTPRSRGLTQRPAPEDSLTAYRIAFILRYGASVRPRPQKDQWLGRDKAKHVAFSALWTLSTQYVLVNKAGWREEHAIPASVGSAAAMGVAKEVYDAGRRGRTASAKDLAADAVGIGLALTVIVL